MTNFDGNQTSQVVCKSEGIHTRIKILVGVHLVLGIVPVTIFFLPRKEEFLPILSILILIPIPQLLLVSFWSWFVKRKKIKKYHVILNAILYLSLWPIIGSASYTPEKMKLVPLYGGFIVMGVMIVIISKLSLAFVLKKHELCYISDPKSLDLNTHFQYSIIHILVVVTIAALILGLMQSAQIANRSSFDWRLLMWTLLILASMVFYTICPAWAALRAGNPILRILLVNFAAIFLGIINSMSLDFSDLLIWIIQSSLFTIIIIASLLVVRSCGYRLVLKTPVPN
jgi:hypothetical protein